MRQPILAFCRIAIILALIALGPVLVVGASGPTPSAGAEVVRQDQAGVTPQALRPGVHTDNIQLLGQLGGSATAVASAGNYAYLGIGPYLAVIDISDPAAPVEVGRTAMLPNIVEDVVVAGDFAYVAAGAAGLRVINVANPAQPAEVGFYEALDAAKGVAVAGTTAYVADEDAGLVTVNVADPANPTLLGAYDSPGVATGVAVAGNIAYLADGPGGLRLV
ncbi:MAG: LVIVD repeat-containing protein, partial [Anaerolineae bacterium]